MWHDAAVIWRTPKATKLALRFKPYNQISLVTAPGDVLVQTEVIHSTWSTCPIGEPGGAFKCRKFNRGAERTERFPFLVLIGRLLITRSGGERWNLRERWDAEQALSNNPNTTSVIP